jgi:hypothetical protein
MRTLPFAALSALTLLALLAGPAHADPTAPTLPPGWLPGGPAGVVLPPPPPSPLSRTSLQLASSPPLPPVAAVTLSLADLDTVEIAPAPTYTQVEASNAEPRGDPPTDLFVAPGCVRLSVSGHAVGSITLGWMTMGTRLWSDGGVPFAHGADADGKHLYDRLEWESLDRLPDGTLRFTETVARLQINTCKATVARRYSAVARPILDGRGYAFRTRCAACAPEERDQLHLITPGGDTVLYSRRAVALAPRGAHGFRTRVETVNLRAFAKATGRPLADPKEGQDAVIGVEATQALGEPAPTVIAYTFDDPKRGWGF